MSKTPKFNFVPEHQLGDLSEDSAGFNVSIYRAGTMVFSKFDVEIYKLDEKFIKLYADKSNRTIGWSILEGNIGGLEEMEGIRQLKKTANGNVIVGIKKLLKSILGYGKIGEVLSLPVERYKNNALYPHPIDYVVLPDVVLQSKDEEEPEDVKE